MKKVETVLVIAQAAAQGLVLYYNIDKKDASVKSDFLNLDPLLGDLLSGELKNIFKPFSPIPDNGVTLYFDDKAIDELWIAVTWSG